MMIRKSLSGLALVALTALPAAAQIPAPPPLNAPVTGLSPLAARRIQDLETQVRTVSREIENQQFQLPKLRQQFSADSPEVKKANEQFEGLVVLRAKLLQNIDEVVQEDRAHSPAVVLSRPVNVQFRDATVAQALEALGKASQVQLVADPSIATAKRLTIEARGVAVGQVLESIGQQTDLEISLDPDGGIRVRPWPTLAINGENQVLKSSTAPWSDPFYRALTANGATSSPSGVGGAYFQPLAMNVGFPGAPGAFAGAANTFGPVGGATGLPGGLPGAPGITVPGTMPPGAGVPGMSGMPGMPGMLGMPGMPGMEMGLSLAGSIAGLSVAPIADHMVVVAEPGPGPKGEPGAYLTIYRLEGNQLRKVGQTFHRSAAAGHQLGMPGMGMPGLGGGGLGGMAPGGLPGGAGFGGPTLGGFNGGGAPAGGGPGFGGPAGSAAPTTAASPKAGNAKAAPPKRRNQ